MKKRKYYNAMVTIEGITRSHEIIVGNYKLVQTLTNLSDIPSQHDVEKWSTEISDIKNGKLGSWISIATFSNSVEALTYFYHCAHDGFLRSF